MCICTFWKRWGLHWWWWVCGILCTIYIYIVDSRRLRDGRLHGWYGSGGRSIEIQQLCVFLVCVDSNFTIYDADGGVWLLQLYTSPLVLVRLLPQQKRKPLVVFEEEEDQEQEQEAWERQPKGKFLALGTRCRDVVICIVAVLSEFWWTVKPRDWGEMLDFWCRYFRLNDFNFELNTFNMQSISKLTFLGH